MIRNLRFEDAAQLFEIITLARKASRIPIGPLWSEEQIAEECRATGYVFEPERGSSLGLQSFILFRDTGAAWEITCLATAPDFQGQGFMKALLEHMREDRPADRAIWLEVHAENVKARRLYEQQGFEVVGERPRYYSDGGTAILYNLQPRFVRTPAEA